MKKYSIMNDKLTIACVIPARLNSTRFPEKILAKLQGKPLLAWDWQAARATNTFDTIAFAIDSSKTATIIDQFGGTYFYTAPQCLSGTDRLIELMTSGTIKADIWVNWQADEPFITPQMIKTLLQTCDTNTAALWTLKKRITSLKQALDPNIVKVVSDTRGYALYFSRSLIPFYRHKSIEFDKMNYYKHLGIYAYTQKALEIISTFPTSALEKAEQLEQLRFLQHGLTIQVHETDQDTISIDRPIDMQKAELYLKSLSLR